MIKCPPVCFIHIYTWLYLVVGITSCCPCHKGPPDPVIRWEGPINRSYLSNDRHHQEMEEPYGCEQG